MIEQVEQLTRLALEGPDRRFARIPSVAITGAAEVLVFPIRQLVEWLLFGCKKQREQRRERFVRAITGFGGVNARLAG